MRDKTRGIYQKFEVIRADGSGAPGGKHENCFYFVLDCSHDPHAEAALKAYIASCRLEYPHLARDLECVLDECQFGRNTMVSSPVEPSPDQLVDALQDRVHKEIGITRPAHAVKATDHCPTGDYPCQIASETTDRMTQGCCIYCGSRENGEPEHE